MIKFTALIIPIGLLILSICNAQQSFSETPTNQSVAQGSEAVLKCSIKKQKGSVVWCKDDSFCTFGRQRNFTDSRFELSGEESKGEHHLRIKNVSLIDDTKYQCQVTASESESAIKSDWAYLSVLVAPSSIKIISNNKLDNSSVVLIKNQSTTIECIAEDSNPACELVWYLDSNELNSTSEVSGLSVSNKRGQNKLYKTTGKITIKPKEQDDWQSKQLKCQCKNEMTLLQSLTIEDTKSISVNYAPVLKIVKIGDSEIMAGSFIQFECNSDSKPPITHFKWYIGDKVYQNGSDEKFLILKIEESMNKQVLKCDGKNEISTQTATLTIELTYGPKFKQEPPSHKIAKLNDRVEISCDIDSNPASSIIWTLNDTFIYSYSRLVINSVRPESYGVYTCTASLKNFPKVSSSMWLMPPGPPIVEAQPLQQAFFGREGQVVCIFESEPKPDQIDWFKLDTKLIIERSGKYRLRSEQVPRKGLKSILVIIDVNQNDYNNYTCRGTNSYGSTAALVRLEPEISKLNNALVSLLIFLFFLLIVCLMSTYSYYWICRKQPERSTRKSRLRNAGLYNARQAAYRTYANRRPKQNTMSRSLPPYGYRTTRRPISHTFRANPYYQRRYQSFGNDLGSNSLDTNQERPFEMINPINYTQYNSYESFNYLDNHHNYMNDEPSYYQTDV